MSILDQIFQERRLDVERAKGEMPLAELKARVADKAPPRGFLDSLLNRNHDVGLIAEIKPASPSEGVINAKLDPALIAQHYAWAGAHALSVLTEPNHFGGSKDNLHEARAACPLPVLRKDFIADPYQVYESRCWEADAILLIATALTLERLRELQSLAQELGMDALVEVHSVEDAEKALLADAAMIGVNNRDLASLRTDLAVSERILPLVKGRALCVSESALQKKADVARVQTAGADAVLIGTVFCASENVEAKVREVMGW
jgi:indole-3-glycerol phosphate synthase